MAPVPKMTIRGGRGIEWLTGEGTVAWAPRRAKTTGTGLVEKVWKAGGMGCGNAVEKGGPPVEKSVGSGGSAVEGRWKTGGHPCGKAVRGLRKSARALWIGCG